MTNFLVVTAVFPAIATVWFAIFWLAFPFWRRHFYLTAAAALAVVGGALVAELVWIDRLTRESIAMPIAAQVIGWLVVAASFVLGVTADRQIGIRVRSFLPFFDDAGRIDLVTTGAYGVVRHPIYASGIYYQLGVFLITGDLAVAIACPIFAIGAMWFTRQEERRLLTLLADPAAYERYREEVPALFPRMIGRWRSTATRDR